jgi:hypothetical protein
MNLLSKVGRKLGFGGRGLFTVEGSSSEVIAIFNLIDERNIDMRMFTVETLSCEELAKLAEVERFRDVALRAMQAKGCPAVKK